MVVSWPKGIKPDAAPRPQFHHVNDIAPTHLRAARASSRRTRSTAIAQDPIDGVSMAYTFADADAPGRKTTQYFENNGSRGIYRDGWYRLRLRPAHPLAEREPGLATWDANKDVWELYDLTTDFSQANDLAAQAP